ncbi:MAG: T9SS type A sorting domain-containing protein [Bacteroidota bacterium]|nr:T9SS type A sorting domain-containing protein [Bacteroidota bacterium]
MKKSVQILSALLLGTALSMNAQTQRISLFEEWTGENCGPCAATNPGITTLANANFTGPKKLILLRYQVAIPSAPTYTASLYQQNSSEPTARQSYYYPSSGDRFAPQGRLNGGELGIGDPNQGHAGFLDQPSIDGAYLNDAPFALTTGYTWNATFDSVTITTTITAAQAFSTANPLKLQLAIIEEEIHYATAPGSNGEKDFEFVMRKMVPSQTGQTLVGTWTNGQTQTIVNTVKMPTYIWNKGEVAIVGFIQEDVPSPGPNTVRTVHQAAYGNPQPLAIDATVTSLSGINASSCSPDFTPSLTIANAGVSTLTSCTINYKIDNGTVMTQPWTGSIATGQNEVVALPMQTATAGTHTFTAYTSNPNGASDNNIQNDDGAQTFIVFGPTSIAPISQAFATTGIPAGYSVGNPDGGYTWARVTTMGGCLKYDAYNNGNEGDLDYFYLPRLDFTGLSNMEIKFDVAHRPYDATYLERLELLVSPDCGTTWTSLYDKSGATLGTGTATTSAFTPTTAANWRTETVSLASYSNAADLLFAFKLTNGYGNNVYLDNINVSTPVGVKEIVGVTNVSVFPNPANNSASLKINSETSENVTVSMYNTIGQQVYTVSEKISTGINVIDLNTAELSNGIYNIIITNSTGKIVQKLTVNH